MVRSSARFRFITSDPAHRDGRVVYFTADDGDQRAGVVAQRRQLRGTILLKDIFPGLLHLSPANLVRMGNVIYFFGG